MIPTLLVVSGLSIFALALLTTGLTTKRSVNHQADDYRLSSAVESIALLAMDELWSGYLQSQGGAASTITTFRDYMDGLGIPDSGPGGAPSATEGTSILPALALPSDAGEAEFHSVDVEAVMAVRRDVGQSTRLYLTVSASTQRGKGFANPVLNRAVQQVWTIEPDDFDGFDFAMLANNVNCIFCHTSVDNVERWFNDDAELAGTFDRVKVGSLETLMLRHDMDGLTAQITDFDADSYVAGTVYLRGTATDHDGDPIHDWADLTFQGYEFDDVTGAIQEDAWGGLSTTPFVPAGDPPAPLENLYLGYPSDYPSMVDGNLPIGFPAPIPDDGGEDPATGLPDPLAAGNKVVDDAEFHAIAETAEGAITAGIITLVHDDEPVDTPEEYASALFEGNLDSVQQVVPGNLILSGTEDNPITIDGTVAVDGDLIINGVVKGEGSLVVRGNVYVPTDLEYLDGQAYLDGDAPGSPTGPRTFGIAQDGTKNALGLACGGNMLVGDYLAPAHIQPDGSFEWQGKFETVSGDSDGEWSFSLAEISIFNRAEWAKTQPFLPGSPGEAMADPSTWTLANPSYAGPGYVPRYYHYGPDDAVPIYNRGDLYYDPATGTWRGDAEVPLFWDADKLTIADPTDPSDPTLFHPDGTPAAVLSGISPNDGWITEEVYKMSIEYFEDHREDGDPMAIDGLLYTNNAIFALVSRYGKMWGQMVLNGSIVAADLGMLVPGFKDVWGVGTNHSPNSQFAIGLQLNYDERVKDMLNVENPFQVKLKRTLWNPTANVL